MSLVIDEDRLSETFAALANPTRRAILARLAEGEASVNDLAQPFDLTLPAISKHIKVLERAGLGRTESARPVPAVHARCDATRSHLDVGRAVPAGLGSPLRPHARLHPATPTTAKDRRTR